MIARTQKRWALTAAVAGGVAFFFCARGLKPGDGGVAFRGAGSTAPAVITASTAKVKVKDADDSLRARWAEVQASPAGLERDRAMTAMLQELAAMDPGRALSMAEAEVDQVKREEFFQAVLRGWAVADPEAAMAWAEAQTFLDRGLAASAVFHGMAHEPGTALRLTALWSVEDPERAGDFSGYLVAAFARAEKFDHAVVFAGEAPSGLRTDLLTSAFASWSALDPQKALAAVRRISDPEMRHVAFTATVSRWAGNAGKEVVLFAQTLPEGSERSFALSTGFRAWAEKDVVGAAAWLGRLEPSLELDRIAVVMASMPESFQYPEFAASCAESIGDSALRVRMLASVVKTWAERDPVAARAYAETSLNIRTDERADVMTAFEDGFTPVSLAP